MKKKTTKKTAKKTTKTKSKAPKKSAKKVSKKVVKKAKTVKKKIVKKTTKTTSRGTPQVGDPCPSFQAKDDQGQNISLSQFLGKKNVVLYFYPKDDTPGCTIEACSFQEHLPDLDSFDAIVVGVSGDTETSHQKFKNKFALSFPLLVDQDFAIAKAFGAYGPKNMYGKTYMGITRSTFVIGKDGKIAAAWPTVKVDGHTQQVLDALRSL